MPKNHPAVYTKLGKMVYSAVMKYMTKRGKMNNKTGTKKTVKKAAKKVPNNKSTAKRKVGRPAKHNPY